MSEKLSARRVPRQARSRARLENILETASAIIARNGADALKMSDVAAQAGISIGSLYQYFPDKSALIYALTERELLAAGKWMDEELTNVTSVADAIVTVHRLVDDYYQRMRSDPALRDIWYGMQADKNLQHLDIEDSRVNGKHIFAVMKAFVPKARHASLRHFCFMIAHLAGAMVRMATSVSPREGRALINEFKAMVVERVTAFCTES